MTHDPSAQSQRPRQSLLRQLAHQAATHPRIEGAILGALRAELPGVIEELLRQSYGGDTLEIYVASRSSSAAKGERDRRIMAMATGPAALPTVAIAQVEGISERRVRQILQRGNSPP